MIIKYHEIGERKAIKDMIGKVGDIIVCVNFLKRGNSIIVMYGIILISYYSSIWG